jgi:two-component system sensor histidine kinase KdpD
VGGSSVKVQQRRAPGFRALSQHAEAALVALATLALVQALRGALSLANLALLLMLAVVFTGLRHGLLPALTSSLVCGLGISFLHARPLFSLRVDQLEDLVTLGCFLVASVLTGSLAARFHDQLHRSSALAERNERLLEASRHLADAASGADLIVAIRRAVEDALQSECVLLLANQRGALEVTLPGGPDLDPAARADAGWCFTRAGDDPHLGERAGSWAFLRLEGEAGPLGVLGVRRSAAGGPLEPDQRLLLLALREMAAVAFDRRRLADRMRDAQLEAERSKLRTALLSSVSHDLRTPLSGILGAAGMLVDFEASLPDGARKELLATVLGEGERLDRFVANLIDMTRLGSGGPVPSPSWCDLRDIVAEALRGLSRVLADRELEVRISPDFRLLHVDGFLLERVLANLLDNAAKYSAAGSLISLTAHREGDTAVVRVIDRGQGIPVQEREAVFAWFHRARQGDRRVAGTGLGLAICRGLTEALRGSIQVQEGPEGKGTCIEIRLPIDREPPEMNAA